MVRAGGDEASDVAPPGGQPLADIAAEARRLLDVSADRGLSLRLLGGLAVALRVGSGRGPLFPREYQDIDFVVPKGTLAREIAPVLVDCGYVEDQQFNTINGHRRLLFYDRANSRQVDVFLATFSMCHEIPLEGRIDLEPDTLPLAELLLTKLQIVELNDKDLRDILSLLHGAELGDDDGARTVNVRRVGALCGADWGLWRTATLNIERARQALDGLDLPGGARDTLEQRLHGLHAAIEAAPKSRRWNFRSKVGDRVRWYEDVEEVG